MADYTLGVKATLDDQISPKLGGVKDKVEDLGGATSAADGKTSAFGGTLKAILASNLITSGISAITDGIKGFATEMVSAGQDFEAQMDKVGAISGASAEDMTALTEKAKEMGATTKFTATESGEAFEYMAMAGWKTGDMLSGIEGIMNLAAASGEDLGTTSDIVTDALTAFGLQAQDSGHFADILAAASSNANTNVGMMGETFKFAAPVAGSLGFTAEDTAQAIGLMANAGIKSSQAGTALRGWMTRMVKPTKEATEAMGALGISYANSDGSMKSLDQIMSELRSSFSGLTEQQKGQYAAMLAGQNAVSGFLAIVNASDEDVNKLGDAIANCSYNVDDIRTKLENGGIEWQKYSDQAWASTEGMSGMMDDIIYNLGTLGSTAEETQQYLMLEYNLDAADALAAVQTVQDAMQESTGAATKMAEEMQDNLAGQVTIFQSSMEGLQLEFFERLQGPLTGIVKFGSEAVQKLTKGLDEEGVPGMLKAAHDIGESAIEGLKDKLPGILETGGQAAWQFISGVLSMVPDIVLGGIELLDELVQGIDKNMGSMLDAGTETSSGFLAKVIDFFPKLLEAGGKLLLHIVEGILNNLPELVAAGFKLGTDLLGQLIEFLPQFMTTGLEIIGSLISGVIEKAPDVLAEFGQMALNLLGVLWEHMPDFLKHGIEMIKNIIDGVIEYGPDALKSMFDFVCDLLDRAADALEYFDWISFGKDIVYGIGDGITKAANFVWDALYDAVSEAWDNALEWLGIASPSKRARDEIGYYWGAGVGVGYAEGLDDYEPEMIRQMDYTMQALTPEAVTTGTSGGQSETVENNSNSRIIGGVSVNVYGAQNQNEEEIANKVMNKIYDQFELAYSYA